VGRGGGLTPMHEHIMYIRRRYLGMVFWLCLDDCDDTICNAI
jgi:hypothetical protein